MHAPRKILTLKEVSEMTRIPLNTLRYLRATDGNMPRTWRLGERRVVAYEDDVVAWLNEQYETTSTTRPAV